MLDVLENPNDPESLIINSNEINELMTSHYKKYFSSEKKLPEIKPLEKNMFIKIEEVYSAIKSIKKNKALGWGTLPDDIL